MVLDNSVWSDYVFEIESIWSPFGITVFKQVDFFPLMLLYLWFLVTAPLLEYLSDIWSINLSNRNWYATGKISNSFIYIDANKHN